MNQFETDLIDYSNDANSITLIYKVNYLTKYKIVCTRRLAKKFDEIQIQCKNFPKVGIAYFLSLYGLNISM